MPISDTYKRLIKEAFKDMEASEKYTFLLWALDMTMREFYKDSNETKTMKEGCSHEGLPCCP
jgi:hypothetical protein